MSEDDCEICTFANQYHHWPLLDNDGEIANPGDKMLPGHEGRKNAITHCGGSTRAGVVGCHRSWTSTAQAHCVADDCHEQFATNGTADWHWVNDGPRGAPRKHVHPSESDHLVSVDEQFGPVWHRTKTSDADDE